MQPTNGQTLRTLLAVRVSTVGQGIDGDSPEAQIEQGERYAPLHNMRIVMTLQYLESASKEQQPMQEVINYCKRHKARSMSSLLNQLTASPVPVRPSTTSSKPSLNRSA